MNDAQIIYRWHLCEQKSKQLGMVVRSNGSSLVAAGTEDKKGFKAFYASDSVDGILGFLEGVIRAQEEQDK